MKEVSAGSPSHGEDTVVYVFDINQLSLPIPFYFVLVSISVIVAFNCLSIHKFSQQLPALSFCSSGVISR